MIKFYYSTAPNPMKVALCLEEMGLAYEPIPVDTRKGAQHKPEYLAVNPNAKVPSIVDARLAKNKYVVGDAYTVVDMALWGWARLVPNILGEHAAKLANVKRLVDEISARPAAQKAIALKDRYTFKTEMDEEAKRAMFPSNYRAQAAG